MADAEHVKDITFQTERVLDISIQWFQDMFLKYK